MLLRALVPKLQLGHALAGEAPASRRRVARHRTKRSFADNGVPKLELGYEENWSKPGKLPVLPGATGTTCVSDQGFPSPVHALFVGVITAIRF